ncbi:MAG: GatB/YqeY domain-containing protein [Campylobacter sp.]|nr:GatB/YqeY domain-containing protein [Campylobacter sp.]
MIYEQIKNDIKDAMRAKDNFRRDTLRMISAAFKQIEVDEKIEIDDERALQILQSEIKKRNDSATQYKDGAREDLAEKELKEIDILQNYLPKQLLANELEEIILETINELGATSLKDLGSVIKVAREKIGARSDGKSISQVAKSLLGEIK